MREGDIVYQALFFGVVKRRVNGKYVRVLWLNDMLATMEYEENLRRGAWSFTGPVVLP